MSDRLDRPTLLARQALIVMSVREVAELWAKSARGTDQRYEGMIWAIGLWRFGDGFDAAIKSLDGT